MTIFLVRRKSDQSYAAGVEGGITWWTHDVRKARIYVNRPHFGHATRNEVEVITFGSK